MLGGVWCVGEVDGGCLCIHFVHSEHMRAHTHSLSLGLQVCVFVSKIYYSCIISWSVIFERLSMYVCVVWRREGRRRPPRWWW